MEENNQNKNKSKGNNEVLKFILDIEGKEYPWHKDTITTEEITGLDAFFYRRS